MIVSLSLTFFITTFFVTGERKNLIYIEDKRINNSFILSFDFVGYLADFRYYLNF